ncbi:MAG: VanZ family protein [Candidatus Aadella gelida]|nr:VanZ family protein [Candidatus Aadella gelida]
MRRQANVRERAGKELRIGIIMFKWIKEDKPIFAWVPSILWALIILMFSTLPLDGKFPLLVGNFDKLAHFCEYLVLSALILRGSYRTWGHPMAKNIAFALISACVYGIVMELIQAFIPGREMELQDILYNLSGAIFGIMLGRLMLWQK